MSNQRRQLHQLFPPPLFHLLVQLQAPPLLRSPLRCALQHQSHLLHLLRLLHQSNPQRQLRRQLQLLHQPPHQCHRALLQAVVQFRRLQVAVVQFHHRQAVRAQAAL